MLRKLTIMTAVLAVMAGAAAAANVELKLSHPVTAKLVEATCLHEAARGDSAEVLCMNAGAELTLVARMQDQEKWNGKSGYWYKASLPDGGAAWVFSTFIEIAAAPARDDCSTCKGCVTKK